jgi:hypothetical protein
MGSDEWIGLLTGTSDADEAGPLVKTAGKELDRLIELDPQLEARLVAILDRTLGRPIDNESLVTTQNALATYLGDNIAFLIVWLSAPSPTLDRLNDFQARASERASTLVRSVLARYWQELRDAQDFAGQSADEWKSLSQEAFLDQITEKYTVRIRIAKYSGEKVVLEASPNSALGLVKFVTRALGAIATAGLFDPTNLEEYFADVDHLRSRLTAEGDAERVSVPAAQTGAPSVAGDTRVPELVD